VFAAQLAGSELTATPAISLQQKAPHLAGLFVAGCGLEIEIVFGQLLVQAALFEKIIDDAALGQVGFGNLNRGFGVVGFFCDKVFLKLKFFFRGAHLLHSRLQGPFGHLIAAKPERVKKIFSIDLQVD
jgi:hypothetical protein